MGSFGVGLGEFGLPELFGATVVLEDLLELGGVVEFDAGDALADPIEEELGGRFAEAGGGVGALDVERAGGGEAKGVGDVGDGADEEPAAFVEGEWAEEVLVFKVGAGDCPDDFSVLDDFEGGEGVARIEEIFELDVQRFAFWEPEGVAGELAVGADAEEGAIGDEDTAGAEVLEPFFVGDGAVEVDVGAVVADWVGEDAGGAAGGRGEAEAAVQEVVVNFLGPEAVAVRGGEAFGVAGAAPGFVGIHAGAVHVVVGDADGVGHPGGDPERGVIPKRFFDVDPDARMSAGLGEELHGRRVFVLGVGDGQWAGEVEVEEGAAGAFVLAGHEVVETVGVKLGEEVGGKVVGPWVLLVPPGDDRGEVEVFGAHEEWDVGDGAMDVEVAGPPSFAGEVGEALEAVGDALGTVVGDGELAGGRGVFGAAFDLVSVGSGRELEDDFAGANEMVAPGGEAGGEDGFAGGVLEVDSTGNQGAGLGRLGGQADGDLGGGGAEFEEKAAEAVAGAVGRFHGLKGISVTAPRSFFFDLKQVGASGKKLAGGRRRQSTEAFNFLPALAIFSPALSKLRPTFALARCVVRSSFLPARSAGPFLLGFSRPLSFSAMLIKFLGLSMETRIPKAGADDKATSRQSNVLPEEESGPERAQSMACGARGHGARMWRFFGRVAGSRWGMAPSGLRQ